MKGSVVKKRNKWYVIVEGPRDNVTNKRKRQWFGGFDTKREAEAQRIEILSQMQKSTFITPSKLTVSAFIDEWLDSSRSQYKPSTFSVMTRHLQNHVKCHIGSIKLQSLQTKDINHLYRELSSPGYLGRAQGLSTGTIKGVHAYLRKALNTAEKWGYLAKNPATHADIPKDHTIEDKRHVIWTKEEIATFFKASEEANDKYFPLWVFFATTGVRRGEALAIEWKDIDFEKDTCKIRQNLVCVDHIPSFQTPKTRSSIRTISLPQQTITALKKQRKWQNEHRLAHPGIWDKSHDLVFTHEDGRLLHPERVLKEFQRRSERYGVKQVTIHSMRHCWATFAGLAGISPNVMKEHLGHSTITITMDTYSHVFEVQERESAAIVADQMMGS